MRFFFLLRKSDSQLTFDIDLARAQSEENPVYYVQYAHARVCSVLRQGAEFRPTARPRACAASICRRFPVPTRTRCCAVSRIFRTSSRQRPASWRRTCMTFYLKELAAEFHSYYNAEQFLVDDDALRQARLALVVATGQVIRNGLAVLGVKRSGKNVIEESRMNERRSTAIPLASRRAERAMRGGTLARHLRGPGTGTRGRRGDRAISSDKSGLTGSPPCAGRAKEIARNGKTGSRSGDAQRRRSRDSTSTRFCLAPEEPKLAKAPETQTQAGRSPYGSRQGPSPASPDAENLKARLALSGWEAAVQTATLPDKTVRYRVRLGPLRQYRRAQSHQSRSRQERVRRRGDQESLSVHGSSSASGNSKSAGTAQWALSINPLCRSSNEEV